MMLRKPFRHSWWSWGMSNLTFAPLASFAEVTMGQSPGAELCNTNDKGLPFLQGCAEFGSRYPLTAVYCDPPLRTARAGSVLISVRAPVGTMNYADQDYCIGRGLGAFKAKPGISNTVFLKHAVEHNAGFLHRRSQGSTFAAVSTDDVRSVPVPTFAITKQTKIAAILTATDSAIEKTETLIAKYQQIKAGLMHDLFTRGVLPNGQLRPSREQAPDLYQETAIGWIPREWEVRTLENLLAPLPNNIRSGPFGSALLKHELVEDGIPFLGIDNIHAERFDPDFRRYVSERKFRELAKYKVRPRDVVITIMGTVGRCCVIPDDLELALSSKHLWTMTFDLERVIPELICWQLNHSAWAQAWFRRAMQGGIMDAIQSSTLKTLRLPVPSIDEQELIYARYLKVSTRIQQDGAQLEKLRKQKLGLMQDLLTGRVPVQVDEPEAVDA
ncbi:restriction endonuclease subunit S [Burkholderia pseudomallei]|nr:restriction endonuclease subunit S [Burkholderia pseudomallei]RPE20054.1 restriction endonuclease subunit S [Burkholderia pseudomallei]RQS89241.1 restriction endonuclease subunit S [Burkholderia pseudomallei]RQZ48812.1 restriction endonuclease subunit S [Burkholderia pseudomallei]